MKVPLLDLSRIHQPVLADMQKAAADVLADGRYILGPNVKAFEEEMASACQVEHAVGVSNGTDALRLALMALHRLHGGGTVITTPFTFIATAEAVVAAGFDVAFADVNPDTALLDPEAVESLITPETVGIVPVHLFGQCVDMDPLEALAKKHGLWIVEDNAQATGALYKGRTAGAMGDAGCFSFFPSKNLGGVGDGGLVISNRQDVAELCRSGRRHGASVERYRHDFIAGNFRLDELQAAILRVKLPHLAAWNLERTEVADRYLRLFAEAGLLESRSVRPLARQEGSTHVYHQFVVRVDARDRVLHGLREAGIGVAVYYPIPLNRQEAFGAVIAQRFECPNSLALADEVLALPVFPGLTEEEQRYVVETLSGLVNEGEKLR